MRRNRLTVRARLALAGAGLLGLTAVACEGAAQSVATPGVDHYEYVIPDGSIYVYDIDHGQRLIQRIALPGVAGVRGVAADVPDRLLFISYGGDAGATSAGHLLAYDLLRRKLAWTRTYQRGVDSMAVDPRAGRIYMPDGELSTDGIWTVLSASTGAELGTIDAGLGPHNTVVGAGGAQVYLGGRNSPYLDVASTTTDRVIRRIGPLGGGVRPFTINGRQTLAYTTATGVLGFQVSSVATGGVLYTVGFGSRFRYDPATFAPSAPSHGISLSPDERWLWVIDGPNSYLHVFDVSRTPTRRPRPVADLALAHPLNGSEAPCAYDCSRDGWIQHSLDGCYVYVGDSGDVYSARTLRPVAFLPPLRNTRKMLEIDWRGGVPVATSTRTGLGQIVPGRKSQAARRCP